MMKRLALFVALALMLGLLLAPSASAAPAFRCDDPLDNFNRANSSTLGSAWTQQSPSIGIEGIAATNPNQTAGLATFNGTTSHEACADVFDNGTGVQYVALVLGYADNANNVFVKVQNNGGSGFNTAYFYYGNNGSCNSGSCSFPLTPFSAARIHVVVTGNVVRLDIDTNFDNVAEQSLTLSYNPPFNLGSGIGLGVYGNSFARNFSIPAPPAVSSLSPSSGTVSGGTTVAVSGHDLIGTGAVKFGAVAAKSFTVKSDDLITAVAPASTKLGAVGVSVKTVYGQSLAVAGDRFTYTGCDVPRLKGKTVTKAKKALKAAGCKLGKVKGKHHRVKKQSPGAGTILPPGGKVSFKLG